MVLFPLGRLLFPYNTLSLHPTGVPFWFVLPRTERYSRPILSPSTQPTRIKGAGKREMHSDAMKCVPAQKPS
jgi:hypothetical protein